MDDRFVEALHMLAFVDGLLDCLTYGAAPKKTGAVKHLLDGQLLPRMEARLDILNAKKAA